MLILAVNDDGVHSRGLRDLTASLATLGTVYVTAPSGERSAVAHALTMRQPIIVEEVEMPGAERAWSIDGTPADCIKLGLEVLLEGRVPDVVVSGINSGPNLGTDVLYSGTVSAAMEGVIAGLPSMAVSLAGWGAQDYSVAASFAAKLCSRLATSGRDVLERTLLNVNVPPIPEGQIKGVKITRLGEMKYTNVFDRRVDPRGRTYFWMAGTLDESCLAEDGESCDTWAVRNDYISVTPIRFDFTAHSAIALLEQWGLEP